MRSVILPRGEREAVPRAVWVARVAATVAIIGLTAALVADVVKPPPAPLEVAELGMCFIALDVGETRPSAPSAHPGAPSAWHAVRQCPALAPVLRVASARIEEARRRLGDRRRQRPCSLCAGILRDGRRHQAKAEEWQIMLREYGGKGGRSRPRMGDDQIEAASRRSRSLLTCPPAVPGSGGT